MKYKNLFFCLILLSFTPNEIYSQTCESYRVTDIDSTENYFLISVVKNERKFLIVSSKKRIKPHRRILLSENYCFRLIKHKWIEDTPLKILVSDIPTSLVIEGKTIWSTEDDYDVYNTKNLKGLNYVKRCRCR